MNDSLGLAPLWGDTGVSNYRYVFKYLVDGGYRPSLRLDPQRRLTPGEAWHEGRVLGETKGWGEPVEVFEVEEAWRSVERPDRGRNDEGY